MTAYSQRSRFLPIRSKRKVLNKYELLRHPSSRHYIDIWQLYKHIRVGADIFLRATPAIFYTNKEFEFSPLEHIGLVSPLPTNIISFHPQFISRIRSSCVPFIAAASLLLYDLTTGNPYESHMFPIIFFPGARPEIHVVDTANHPVHINKSLEKAIIDGLGLDITTKYITGYMKNVYGLDINLQKDENEGYCVSWTAGMIERLGRLLYKLNESNCEEKLEVYKKFYIKLMKSPMFGRDFYNRLAMRTHGISRVQGVIIGKQRGGGLIGEILKEYLKTS